MPLMVLWRLGYKLALRDLPEMFLQDHRGHLVGDENAWQGACADTGQGMRDTEHVT
jgi:hypothetical protein